MEFTYVKQFLNGRHIFPETLLKKVNMASHLSYPTCEELAYLTTSI